MAARNPTSMRVLTRPNPSPSHTTTPSLPPLPDPPPSSPPPGVVVVGFISRRPDDSAQLINRVLDSNVFGSGNLHKLLRVEREEVKDWFKSRSFCYHHDEEKGVLFLQFCATRCPAMDGFVDSCSGFDSAVEEQEFGDLQGLLFMFSVCHVIIYVQEGSRFDIQNLKTFRVLQAAKHALVPHVKSRVAPPSSSRPHSSATPTKNPSPGRSGGMLSRNASGVPLMSGLGSQTSLFPGQCTPVTLFVFIDDFSDVPTVNSMAEESTDTPSSNQSSSSSSLARPSLPAKGYSSVVVLARPASKSEGGLRKKLQASLEAQTRFLIKKCRTLASSESNNTGSRSGGVSSSAPLFSLDASRAVVLLDRFSNQRGESLEFAAGLVVDFLNGKATSDYFLLETHGQNANNEDILSVKEFIYRQCDILRGRGGLVNNANTGSVAGVGMLAVAAAAAAASVASGKTSTIPELPSLEIWLSSSQLIIQGVLMAKRGCIDEIEISKRKPRQRSVVPVQFEGIGSRDVDPLDIAVSLLESGKGLNTKFSTLWCQRALPAAKEVYLKDLPACYPTLQHEAHLEKALCAFHSMVKGPAVQHFVQKLEDECISIWKSGRQLCDAVSLTGKPCMHQRHDIETGDSLSAASSKSHSSGFVFLHACACGRSRRLRSDPFDFETANITSSCFPECDKLLPSLQLPNVNDDGPIRPSSWSLIRVGGMRYYEPSKGLLQSGFCPTERFLLKWTIFLEKRQNLNSEPTSAMQQGSVIRSSTDPKVELRADIDIRKAGAAQLYSVQLQGQVDNQKKSSDNIKNDDKKISFGRGLPNFNMRKPFSEVVAGSASADSGFPPLQQRKQPSLGSEKVIKQISGKDKNRETAHEIIDHHEPHKFEEAKEKLNRVGANGFSDGDPFLQIGSNTVPVHVNGGENIKSKPPLKHVVVHVGFEHECPSGHRFLLKPEHLKELGSLYSPLEESQIPSSGEHLDNNLSDPKFGKNGDHAKVRHNSNGRSTIAMNKVVQFSKPRKERNQPSISVSALPDVVKDNEQKLQSISLDDGGSAFCMLNRNLPLYMNCPHCKLSKNKKDQPKFKSAGTISQLQRIFVVTPPYPVTLATCPLVQFEASCLPPTTPDLEQKLQFNPGCQVILPPESFVTLRLPFVYGAHLKDGSLFPINPFEHQPELTAWITKGTMLQVTSRGSGIDESTPA